jgi:predicted nucleic acid-binding protein
VNYTLDACALIAFLNGEPGREIVADLLKKAADKEITIYMSAVNLVEVFYGYIRDLGISESQPLVISAASRFKGTYKISIADAFRLAAAAGLSATFVTSDHHELEAVENSEPPVRPHRLVV